MEHRVQVEICVTGITSALAAEEGGAQRVELCEYLEVGGVTPSAGMIERACGRLEIPVHVLIRPRGGDFVYNEDELAVMEHDIDAARQRGARGVVLGMLTREGTVDRERTAALMERAGSLSVTFHKAFDAVRDPFEALEDLMALGVERVLTSGGPGRALENAGVLRKLVEQAAGRITILAGGSIRVEEIPRLVAESGAREIHLGSAAMEGGLTSAERVRAIVEAARLAGV